MFFLSCVCRCVYLCVSVCTRVCVCVYRCVIVTYISLLSVYDMVATRGSACIDEVYIG